jgi:hypothetical protein
MLSVRLKPSVKVCDRKKARLPELAWPSAAKSRNEDNY